MATADYVAACDYVGLVSGKQVPDKVERAGFHAVKSEFVDAPLMEELPMALECRLRSYDAESCRLVGERLLRKFCVSEFRQNQEFHILNVHNDGLFPLTTTLPIERDGMRAARGVNAVALYRES